MFSEVSLAKEFATTNSKQTDSQNSDIWLYSKILASILSS